MITRQAVHGSQTHALAVEGQVIRLMSSPLASCKQIEILPS